MIEQFSVYELLFNEINKLIKIDTNIYVIGGAVLLYRDIKPATKDMDIVVDTKEEFNELDCQRYSTLKEAEKGHEEMCKEWENK